MAKPSVKLASTLGGNANLKSFIDRVQKLTEEKNQIMADIKSVYDDAANSGFDRKAFKLIVKTLNNRPTQDFKDTVNEYLDSLNEMPLFAYASK